MVIIKVLKRLKVLRTTNIVIAIFHVALPKCNTISKQRQAIPAV